MIQNNVALNHNLIRFIELFVEYGIDEGDWKGRLVEVISLSFLIEQDDVNRIQLTKTIRLFCDGEKQTHNSNAFSIHKTEHPISVIRFN